MVGGRVSVCWVGLFGRRSRNLGAGRDLENVSLRISKGWGKWDLVICVCCNEVRGESGWGGVRVGGGGGRLGRGGRGFGCSCTGGGGWRGRRRWW